MFNYFITNYHKRFYTVSFGGKVSCRNFYSFRKKILNLTKRTCLATHNNMAVDEDVIVIWRDDFRKTAKCQLQVLLKMSPPEGL